MKLWILLVLPLPAWLWFFVHKKHVNRLLGFIYGQRPQTAKFYRAFNAASILRLIFFTLAWTSLVIALANPKWGTSSVPVQRSGSAVSFVYDISWSMTAKDAEDFGDKSRLEAARDFSELLLSKMHDVEVSCVIAKGQAITAVPLTADYNSVRALNASLSPELMSASGSNPADGILQAQKTFPSQVARYSTILVFTDGEGNAQAIEKAVYEAARCGVSLVFVGFGSEEGSEILAGDRKTSVKTFLHKKEITSVLKSVQEKVPLTPVLFVDSREKSAIRKVLSVINGGENESANLLRTGYEVQPIERHNLFIFLGLVFLCLGFFTSEINYQGKNKATKNITSLLLIFTIFLFVSCKGTAKDSYNILSGTLYFHSENYQKAVSKFVEKSSDEKIQKYADFGLATTYLALGETKTAIEKLQSIRQVDNARLAFAVKYNLGIAAYYDAQYEQAEQYFKDALMLEPKNINAKINLEIAHEKRREAQESQKQLAQRSEEKKDTSAEKTIFSIIRDDEENRWRNLWKEEEENLADDY